ncbi:hypothetical protein BDY19DRAFT_989608 [Irpex rosettiformis]|uniref:Uncharacterized protein n=1 Tax=Irpex rosettiformis TaxID=378272 RepID=A0ACB8UK81_9APHY|nr:hypothetical protein BDY19DRAFT_989608 [Irpex rosettiformis]
MDPATYAATANYLMDAKMYSLASCVMLFYDMFLTFGDEVERIWMQPFTGATVLWFMNRYITPLAYIIITVSFHDPNWGPEACERYVRFPEIIKIFTATAVGIIFILRLYAIWGRSRIILVCFSVLLALEIAVKIWSFTGGIRLHLPSAEEGLIGCILTGNPASNRVMFTWVAELAFDSAVFFTMLYKTILLFNRMPRSTRASSILQVLLRDGVVYFAVIFVSNLVTVLIYVLAIPDLKVINASFSTLITTLMVSRLMLNLRLQLVPSSDSSESVTTAPYYETPRSRRSGNIILMSKFHDRSRAPSQQEQSNNSMKIYRWTEQEVQ